MGTESVSGIETRDGDGVRVQYRQLKGDRWGYVVPGSEAAPLVIHGVTQGTDGVVLATRFPTIGSTDRGSSNHGSIGRRAAMIPREMRWVVAFGDPLGIDTIGANELLDRDATIAVSKPTNASSLPDSVLGYDGVDMMVIGGSSAKLLGSLSANQQTAIRDWIQSGGYVLLTLGESARGLFEAAPWLLELLPIDQLTIVKANPSALETYTSTQTPLDSFAIAKLPRDQGHVLVMGRTTRRISVPLVVEYSVGFGKIVVIAADLEQDLFVSWPERLDLITQLTDPILIPESQQTVTRNRMTSYDDLAGQLRSSLDRFSTRRRVGFSIVSLVLMALIALIGPLDYLLINRLLGRPLLGWVSFPLVAIGMSIVLIWQARPLRVTSDDGTLAALASGLESNQLEIFDIDTIAGVGRGFSARYFYSHDARSVDVSVLPSESLRSISGAGWTMITAPLGNPGRAFGGIPIAIEDSRLPTYRVPFQFRRRHRWSDCRSPRAAARVS